jgi:hypothetical protein
MRELARLRRESHRGPGRRVPAPRSGELEKIF